MLAFFEERLPVEGDKRFEEGFGVVDGDTVGAADDVEVFRQHALEALLEPSRVLQLEVEGTGAEVQTGCAAGMIVVHRIGWIDRAAERVAGKEDAVTGGGGPEQHSIAGEAPVDV